MTSIAACLLTLLHCLQEGLFIGAAVTQSTLIDYLLEAASKPLKQRKHQSNGDKGGCSGGVSGVYTALAHHLQRIAGNQVSSACEQQSTRLAHFNGARFPILGHVIESCGWDAQF